MAAAKMKGLCKSFKYLFQIFVMKDQQREIEIGFPTDVKHVAHIGWDGPSSASSGPTWVDDFKNAQDNFSSSSFGEISGRRDSSFTAVTARTTWSSQDFSTEFKQSSEIFRDLLQIEPPTIPKKKSKHRKSSRSTSSPRTSSNSTSRSSRARKSEASCNEVEPTVVMKDVARD